jgi:hypothetical protein
MFPRTRADHRDRLSAPEAGVGVPETSGARRRFLTLAASIIEVEASTGSTTGGPKVRVTDLADLS